MFERTVDAVLIFLMHRFNQLTMGDFPPSVGQLARENRGNRNHLELDPQIINMAAEASYQASSANDPRTLVDILKEVSEFRQHRSNAKNGSVDRNLLDTLVAILKLPSPANMLTVPNIQTLQDILLRPDEQSEVKLTELTKASRCYSCGHLFKDGDSATYHSPDWRGDVGSVMVCGGCEAPQMVKCAHVECDQRLRTDGGTKFCAIHVPGAKIPEKPKTRSRNIILTAEQERVLEQGTRMHQTLGRMAEPPTVNPLGLNEIRIPRRGNPAPARPIEELYRPQVDNWAPIPPPAVPFEEAEQGAWVEPPTVRPHPDWNQIVRDMNEDNDEGLSEEDEE